MPDTQNDERLTQDLDNYVRYLRDDPQKAAKLKFQVGGSILERSPIYPRDWTVRYYLKGWKTAQSSTMNGPKTWMSWLKLEYNKSVTLDELVRRVQAARKQNIVESPFGRNEALLND